MRPTYALIDLDRLVMNAKYLQKKAGREILCIIKADAYGHGVIPVLRRLVAEGYRFFGVATIEEALELKTENKEIDVLVIGDTPVEDYALCQEQGISVAVHHREDLKAALALPGLRFHLKVDTGMHRLGFSNDELRELKDQIILAQPEGIFTHMARADEVDKSYAMEQFARFREAVSIFDGYDFRWIHFANSASILELDADFSNLVRAGISLYGLAPSSEVGSDEVRPALSWYTEIVDLHHISVGEGVSYSHIWRAERPSRVATLPVGYADGYKRQMSKQAMVWLNGHIVPVVGRITMDQIMIDVTDVPCALGDTVELLGDHITADMQAKWADTINYEIVTTLGKRVRREYRGAVDAGQF